VRPGLLCQGEGGWAVARTYRKLLEPLAESWAQRCCFACERVDAGLRPTISGWTDGENVAPDLYLAIGISGAIQASGRMMES